ncbi:MAG: LVIVD repeat-containing protein [Solirubrobacteraceae bacterium]
MLRRVGLATASLMVLGALALVPTAAGHPEECSTAAAWATNDGYSPYVSWEGAEESTCTSAAVQRGYDDSAAQLAAGETGTDNLELLASRPKEGPFAPEAALNSDIAFEDGYAYQGNYEGVAIWNVKRADRPTLVNQILCPGSQNDVTINDGILVTSTDSRRTTPGCDSVPASDPSLPTTWEGLKVWDVRNPKKPRLLTSVRTDCGSHTHTVLPEKKRLIVYVQSYDVASGRYLCDGEHDQISVVEIPRKDPAAAKVVNEPVLFPDGGNDGTSGTLRKTTGCHDITVYQEIGLAAGACTGQGSIIDISDPVNPKVLSSVEDPNFAFWHSATISQDGKRVLFTDEKGGGAGAECNPTVGPQRGADAVYDITDPANPRFLSYFKIPRTQTNNENCVAHNGNAIPVEGRDILVQSWYQGGVSVIDWTDGANIKELAWFDRGEFDSTRRVLAGFWSSYFYNGHIFGSEIQRGWDVFKLTGREFRGADRVRTDTLNAQTQFSLDGDD